ATVFQNDSVFATDVDTLNFRNNDFSLNVPTSGQVDVQLASTLHSVTGVANDFNVPGNLTTTGATTLSSGAGSATTIGNATGTLQITSTGLQVTTNGGITIPSNQTLTVGTIDLNSAGVNANTSGANLIGVFDNLVSSNSHNLQQVL